MLACHVHSTPDLNLFCLSGNSIQVCRSLLFTDSDFAGNARTSKSTTGQFLALVGPFTFAPITTASKRTDRRQP